MNYSLLTDNLKAAGENKSYMLYKFHKIEAVVIGF